MTDLEITRLCGDAMGHPLAEALVDTDWSGEFKDRVFTIGLMGALYNPLHDDAQAMALVKKFRLGVFSTNDLWSVGFKDSGLGHADAIGYTDLNRAICECVARMQQQAKALGK